MQNIVLKQCEPHNVIVETRGAYRKHQGWAVNILTLSQHVIESFLRFEAVGLVCLVHLFEYNMARSVHHKVDKFFHMTVKLKSDDTLTECFSRDIGLAQGSVIAPIRFLIYVSRLPKLKA